MNKDIQTGLEINAATATEHGLKDSGDRRQFETGAVRDRAVGKGLPALISAPLMTDYCDMYNETHEYSYVITELYNILQSGDWGKAIDIFHSLVMRTCFKTAMYRLSVQLEKGALKYSKRNWEKGMPLEEYINSALRHTFSIINEEDDEDHYAAALFNVMGLYHTGTMIKRGELPKDLNNLPGGEGYGC